MKKTGCLLFLIAVAALLLLPGGASFAKGREADTKIPWIQDNASLLSEAEAEELTNLYTSITGQFDIGIFVITIKKTGVDRDHYIENFYDSSYSVIPKDSVILLLNMAEDNRGVSIQGYGSCEYSVNNNVISGIVDRILPLLSGGNYAGALSRFGEEVNEALEESETSLITVNGRVFDKSDLLKATARNLIIALLAGLLTVFLMSYRRGGRMTAGQKTYADPEHSRLIGSYDRYTHTTTTKRPKPKPENHSGGSGGGGRSGEGHSHSGGGGSF